MASYQQQEIARGKLGVESLLQTKIILTYAGRKRRNSEDEEMADASTMKPTVTAAPRRSFKCVRLSESGKRNPKRSTRGALLGKHVVFTQLYNNKH